MMIEIETFLRAQNNAKRQIKKRDAVVKPSTDRLINAEREFIHIHKINYREKLKQ
jgi:hypothetical protein